MLLKAFTGLGNDSSLLIAGSGVPEYEKRLQSLAADRVHLLGYLNAEDLFQKIDVLIVPSLWHEPFGRVII